MSRAELEVLVPLVRRAAQEELLSRFRRVTSSRKADGSLITEADLAMQQRITDELRQHWPERPLLGEEMAPAEQQHLLREGEAGGVWCLDPLDGTRNFASGFPVFSVSLALITGGEVMLGLVLDPVRDECFTAVKGQGAWLDGAAGGADDLLQAAGRVQLYVHGRQNLWDYAAGRLVFAEAGGHHGTLDGPSAGPADLVLRSAVGAVGAERYRLWQDWLLESASDK